MRFLERLNMPIAVAVVLVLFLVVDGLPLYRYQLIMMESRGGDSPSTITEQRATTRAPSTSLSRTGPTTERLRKQNSATAKVATTDSIGNPNMLRVVVGIDDAPSWIKVQTDGRTVFEQVGQPGFVQDFEADQEINIEAADAGAVSVEVNGRDLGRLGGSGEGTARTFTL
jgi:RodZ C-terminal domain